MANKYSIKTSDGEEGINSLGRGNGNRDGWDISGAEGGAKSKLQGLRRNGGAGPSLTLSGGT